MRIKTFLMAHRDALTKAFAGVMPFDDLVRNVETGVTGKKIEECTESSVLTSLLDAASLKMRPFGYNGIGYLVPSRRGQNWECRFDPGYKGLLELAKRIPDLVVKTPQVVYSNDRFELDLGSSSVKHHPSLEDRGDIVAAYVVWHYRGVQDLEFIGREEIEKIRDCSKAQKPDSPWNQWGGPMTAKSVVRRAAKNWPATQELGYAVSLAYAADEPEAAKNLETLTAPQAIRGQEWDPEGVWANTEAMVRADKARLNASKNTHVTPPVDVSGNSIPVVTVEPKRDDLDMPSTINTLLLMSPDLAARAIVGLFGLHPTMVDPIIDECLPAFIRKFGKGAMPVFKKIVEVRPACRSRLEEIWKSKESG